MGSELSVWGPLLALSPTPSPLGTASTHGTIEYPADTDVPRCWAHPTRDGDSGDWMSGAGGPQVLIRTMLGSGLGGLERLPLEVAARLLLFLPLPG